MPEADTGVYTRARFFKCALQVNPANYVRYRGEQQTVTEDDYNAQLLDAALEAGIDIVGLADHGSVDGVDKLRTLFAQHDIVVFPGFEIASSEKIHFVCSMRTRRLRNWNGFLDASIFLIRRKGCGQPTWRRSS